MSPAKLKIPPPLIALFFATLMWIAARYVSGISVPGVNIDGHWPVVVAIIISIIGVFFCAAGAIAFKRAGTTVNPLKPETASVLVTSGIYQYSRNPMYAGVALLLLAWAIYLQSPIALLGIVGFMLYINYFQITPEEDALTGLFGQAFIDYKARVRRWL